MRKRDSDRTPESPADADVDLDDGPVFVIQEHAAGTHHFDVRLQVGEVLRSWAVPKGPSTDPSEKRLAVATEDHPLEYAEFEGTIPDDEYGGGTVIVWDAGPYTNLKMDGHGEPVPIEDQLDDGHVTVWLHGEKIQGGYALIRTDSGRRERWLMVKMDDERADARRNPVSTEPESVLTGRTVEEVAEEGGKGEGARGS